MKCPKCGYNSFEHLSECKKCGQDLADHKAKFNLRGFYAAGQAAQEVIADAPVDVSPAAEETSGDDSVDFGFDFLEEEDPVDAAEKSVSLGDDNQEVSINRPFEADSETIPADDLAPDDNDDDSDDKPGKGPEFAF
jgi:hypothetical protein